MRVSATDLEAALPDLGGARWLHGLQGRVDVWRDRWGIPHVQAGSVHDAFFGQGFVHAQDRLWQMDADRRRAEGQWAAVVGSAGLEEDILMRRLRLEVSARVDYERGINPETRAMLDAYAAGVNAYIDEALGVDRLPIEYRLLGESPKRWRPWDSLLVYKRIYCKGMLETKVWRARLVNRVGPALAARLLAGYVEGQPLIVPPGAVYSGRPLPALEYVEQGVPIVGLVPALGGRIARPHRGAGPDEGRTSRAGQAPSAAGGRGEGGSNNWAVSGSRTATGRPIVAGDPHIALEVPNLYYQNHLASPELDAVGFSFPGVPGIPNFGHNASVAWCITHGMADCHDLYVERFDPADPGRYWYMDRWREAERTRDVIEIRGTPHVEVIVTVTHHGPIVLGDPADGYAVALTCTATASPNAGFNALLPTLRARSAAELDEAMRLWVDPVQNLVFADTAGSIGYRTRGQVPLRSPASTWLPVPGWTPAHEWHGMIPFEAMPAVRDPEAGFVASANNRIAGAEYPHGLGSDFAPGFRAQRIVERLQSASRLTVEDMAALHADRVSLPARAFARLLRAVEPADDWLAWARELLLAWDGTMDAESVAALVYAAFRERLLRDLVEPILGPLAAEAFDGTGRGGSLHMARVRARLADLVARDDRTLLPEGAAWPGVMQAALGRAVHALRARLGDDRSAWRWGRLHRTRLRHPLSPRFPEAASRLDPPTVGLGGDSETVALAGFAPGTDFTITSGSGARYVFDPSDWSRSGWVVPLGASGHPGSPHYVDQVAPWSEYRLLPMLYDWEEIRRTAESRQTLLPLEAPGSGPRTGA